MDDIGLLIMLISYDGDLMMSSDMMIAFKILSIFGCSGSSLLLSGCSLVAALLSRLQCALGCSGVWLQVAVVLGPITAAASLVTPGL